MLLLGIRTPDGMHSPKPKFDLADDARFALLEGRVDVLAEKERRAVNLVVNTFGMYGNAVFLKNWASIQPIRNPLDKVKQLLKHQRSDFFQFINHICNGSCHFFGQQKQKKRLLYGMPERNRVLSAEKKHCADHPREGIYF